MTHSEVIAKLIQDNNFKIIAEVGVFKGDTAEHLLSSVTAIEQYWGIDQWDIVPKEGHRSWSKWTRNDWDEIYLSTLRKLSKYKTAHIVRLPSVKAATLFPEGYFDLVDIDANHMYEYVMEDLSCWYPLVRTGGIIAGHDYFNSSKSQVETAVKEFFPFFELLEGTVWMHKKGG